MLWIDLHSTPKVLYSTGSERMWHFSLQILCLRGNKDNVKNPYRRAELSLIINRMKPMVEDFLKISYVIFAYELGQLIAE